MLATAVMAGFGFFFWMISARLVSPQNIGIATTLISIMNIIAIFSLIGFDSTIVRFLANSKEKNDKLNTGIILVGFTAFLLSLIFILFVHQISPQLEVILSNTWYSIAFVAFTIMSAINILTDAVFLAYRQTKYSLIINTIFSFVKMLLPLLFAPWGAFGIFTAAAGGQTIGFILSIGVMIWKFDYKPKFTINTSIVNEVWAYSAGNYIAGVLNLLPVTLLPIIITNHIDSSTAGYFYIVMMIANLLYTIPYAATKSLFAEASNDENTITENLKKSVKIVAYLMFPAIAVLMFLGKFILSFFGKAYSVEGIQFLYLVAISGIIVASYSLISSLLRVQKDIVGLIIINIAYASVTLGLAYALIYLGLIGIGISWFFGNLTAGIAGLLKYRFSRKRSVTLAS